ncbi:hypothetical protein PNEG_00360 [Pneumocystis murina B123]|uniref:Uncharacterized protein n=1 Tax=Pneumocystis murina (strain B123) TaxID=1069680 RepID=M7NW34_PNEMU|nr:hypothetical protein PNEG_00360 [Pneumocystis murina B123]EMR11331.1 hypothetical protein PNEG_00360 [Pneumocystis murina B123]
MSNILEKKMNIRNLTGVSGSKYSNMSLKCRKCKSYEEILDDNESFEKQINNDSEKKSVSGSFERYQRERGYSQNCYACNSSVSPKSRHLIKFNERFSKKNISDDLQKNNSYLNEDFLKLVKNFQLNFLWDHLLMELDISEIDEIKEEREKLMINYLLVPKELEKVLLFGWFICLDTLMYFFTISPLRFIKVLYKIFKNNFLLVWENKIYRDKICRESNIKSSEKIDFLEGFLILGTCVILQRLDASRIYHNIRGQATIKLYVIYNVLEIGDRLLSAFGQDVIESFFSKVSNREGSTKHYYLNLSLYFILALIANVLHTTMLFYQVMTLNVTVNSYSNALLTLLISNQFVEIKGTIFKKFENENMLQMTLADIVERFQLTLMLSIILFRNLIEIYESRFPFSLFPSSFFHFSSYSVFFMITTPVILVMGSEIFVDWLKHMFIIKFNHIQSSIYSRFADVLSDYYISCMNKKKDTRIRQPYFISRKIGLPILPLACLMIRASFKICRIFYSSKLFTDIKILSNDPSLEKIKLFLSKDKIIPIFYGTFIMIILFFCLIVMKLILSTILMKLSYKYYNKVVQDKEEGKEFKITKSSSIGQQEIDEKTRLYLNNVQNKFKDGTQKHTLYTLERYSMVTKRIY